MASARYWRLVGVSTYAGGDLELGGLHWYTSGGRIDATATLTCSHAPIAGALANLQDTDAATTARFSADAVRSAGFYLRWDFGSAVTDPWPRLTATVQDRFLAGATLQYSSDAVLWTTDLSFAKVIYPGDGGITPTDPIFRVDAISQWDAVSMGADASIDGRSASVTNNFPGAVRTNNPKKAGRRVFGLQRASPSADYFFAGFSALTSWAKYSTGKNWLMFGYDGYFYFYPDGSAIPLTPSPGAPTAIGDTVYFDVNLDAGTCAVKKNTGAWSAAVSLPNFTVGADYVISNFSPSTSGNYSTVTLLTKSDELAGNIPSGATAWDTSSGTNLFLQSEPVAVRKSSLGIAASAEVPAFATRNHRLTVARDVEFGGPGMVYGTTKVKGTPNTPTRSRVVLLRGRDKLPVRETWSDPITGYYEFRGINPTYDYIVLAEDGAGLYRPVAANHLVPEVTA